jgi:hypothetical protein
VIEHANEARALQCKYPQFRKEFLLANSLPERRGGKLAGLIIAGRRFDYRALLAACWTHIRLHSLPDAPTALEPNNGRFRFIRSCNETVTSALSPRRCE